MREYLSILECVKCHRGNLVPKSDILICSNCGKEYAVVDGVPDFVISDGKENATNGSLLRWEEFHADDDIKKDIIGFGESAEDHIKIFRKIGILNDIGPKDFILDIGCGRGYVPCALARDGRMIVGVDFVLESVLFAKRKFAKEELKGLFIRADMFNLPFKKESFNLVYSLGVLEHCKDIEQPAKEIFRVLKHGGITFNVVPAISVTSLSYGQLWGSIPNIPIIRDIFYWFHYKLLRGRHCIYGYELNYLRRQLKIAFKRVGYSVNKSGVFNIALPIYYIKNKLFKKLLSKVINNRLLTRHIYITSEK